MRAIALTLLVVVAALSQVAVAPLFPVAGALPEISLATLVMLTVFAGPTTTMVAIPAMAIFVGFASGREPGLLLMAYLPLLPVSLLLHECSLPLSRYLQALLAGVTTGMWARFVLALGSIAGGADPAMGTLAGAVIVPGMLLDIALLTMVYAPLRLLGWSGRGMALQRSRW